MQPSDIKEDRFLMRIVGEVSWELGMKYLIVRDEDGRTEADKKLERAIVFDVRLFHKQVAAVQGAHALKVVSAGFCKLRGNTVIAGGRSNSLGVNSRPQDAFVIAEALGIDEGRSYLSVSRFAARGCSLLVKFLKRFWSQ